MPELRVGVPLAEVTETVDWPAVKVPVLVMSVPEVPVREMPELFAVNVPAVAMLRSPVEKV